MIEYVIMSGVLLNACIQSLWFYIDMKERKII